MPCTDITGRLLILDICRSVVNARPGMLTVNTRDDAIRDSARKPLGLSLLPYEVPS